MIFFATQRHRDAAFFSLHLGVFAFNFMIVGTLLAAFFLYKKGFAFPIQRKYKAFNYAIILLTICDSFQRKDSVTLCELFVLK